MNHHEDEHEDDTTHTRRGPLAALAAVGLSMILGPLVTDKAPGLWGPAFLIMGGLVLVLAAALFLADLKQAHGITPNTPNTDDTDNGSNTNE